MNHRLLWRLAASTLCLGVVLADSLKSGPQPGQRVTAFHPLNVFNPDRPSTEGKKNCLV